MKDPKSEAERWFKQAEYDLRAAEHNAGGEFYSIACFNAQQAAEKSLVVNMKRASLISLDWRANWTVSTFPLAIPMPCRVEYLLKSTTRRTLRGLSPWPPKSWRW